MQTFFVLMIYADAKWNASWHDLFPCDYKCLYYGEENCNIHYWNMKYCKQWKIYLHLCTVPNWKIYGITFKIPTLLLRYTYRDYDIVNGFDWVMLCIEQLSYFVDNVWDEENVLLFKTLSGQFISIWHCEMTCIINSYKSFYTIKKNTERPWQDIFVISSIYGKTILRNLVDNTKTLHPRIAHQKRIFHIYIII